MPNASEVAQRLPLITVTTMISFEENRTHHALSTVNPDSTSREVERLCELEPSKYYFASIAVPDFGPIVLVYSPEVEVDSDGSASPFDTGGTLVGRCLPFENIADDEERRERVRQLITETSTPLDEWRAALQNYLRRYYTDPQDYVNGAPPDSVPHDAPDDLPAQFSQRPGDRRSYTWEVRLYEERRIDEYLKCWATDRNTRTALMEQVAMTELPVSAKTQESTLADRLDEVECVVERSSHETFNALQARVEEEVLQ